MCPLCLLNKKGNEETKKSASRSPSVSGVGGAPVVDVVLMVVDAQMNSNAARMSSGGTSAPATQVGPVSAEMGPMWVKNVVNTTTKNSTDPVPGLTAPHPTGVVSTPGVLKSGGVSGRGGSRTLSAPVGEGIRDRMPPPPQITPVVMVVMTALGVAVECTQPCSHSTHMVSALVPAHLAMGYRTRGGSYGVVLAGRTEVSGPYDPVGLMAAYLAGGRSVSVGVTASGLCTGKHCYDGKVNLTLGYSSASGMSGAPSSRTGRPGPNFVSHMVGTGLTSCAVTIMNSVVRVGIRVVSAIVRAATGKFDSMTVSNGLSVGSAVTIVFRDSAMLNVVSSTGVTGGASAASSAPPPDKTYADDLAGVALAYRANGARGISVAGSPVVLEVSGHGNLTAGSPHGGGPKPSGAQSAGAVTIRSRVPGSGSASPHASKWSGASWADVKIESKGSDAIEYGQDVHVLPQPPLNTQGRTWMRGVYGRCWTLKGAWCSLLRGDGFFAEVFCVMHLCCFWCAVLE